MYINLNQLRCFYATAKYGSIKKAAEMLFVSPPAITMQVKKLEKWLGFRLLAKDGNAIKVTKDGRELFRQAKVIFKEVEALELMLEKDMQSRKAEVRIGSHYIPAKYIIPRLLGQLSRLHPQLTFKVVLDTVPLLMEKLKKHELHFVLSSGPPPCLRIKGVPLFTEDIVLVTCAGSQHVSRKEITVDKMKNLPLLLPEYNTSIFHIISEFLEENDISPCIVMDNISADIIKNFILQDRGAAFLLRFTVQDKLDSGELQEIKLLDGYPTATFGLFYLAEKNLSPECQAIISSLEETLFDRSQLV